MLEAFLTYRPRASFLVAPLKAQPRTGRSLSDLFVTDLFIVRPQRIADLIRSRGGSSNGGSSDGGDCNGGSSNDGLRLFFESMCLSRANVTTRYPGTTPLDLSPRPA